MRAANDQNLFRRSIEHEVERLLSLLDNMDGDCDIEANGDELDMSYPEGGQCRFTQFPHEDDEDGADDEPQETDQDGDTEDSSLSEDDNSGGGMFVQGRLDGGAGA
jgi:hypothetical protein